MTRKSKLLVRFVRSNGHFPSGDRPQKRIRITTQPGIWVSLRMELGQSASSGSVQFIQSLSRVQLCATLWTAAHQASLSSANSQSLLKLKSIELVMSSNHLILCCPLFLLPAIFPNIRIFSNESVLCIRWPKYWSFSFSHQSFQ